MPQEADSDSLKAAFVPFGEVKSVEVVQRTMAANTSATNTGLSGGMFALITFEDAEDCEHAIFNMNESEFFGKTIQVSYAKGQHLRLLHGPRGKNGSF